MIRADVERIGRAGIVGADDPDWRALGVGVTDRAVPIEVLQVWGSVDPSEAGPDARCWFVRFYTCPTGAA